LLHTFFSNTASGYPHYHVSCKNLCCSVSVVTVTVHGDDNMAGLLNAFILLHAQLHFVCQSGTALCSLYPTAMSNAHVM